MEEEEEEEEEQEEEEDEEEEEGKGYWMVLDLELIMDRMKDIFPTHQSSMMRFQPRADDGIAVYQNGENKGAHCEIQGIPF